MIWLMYNDLQIIIFGLYIPKNLTIIFKSIKIDGVYRWLGVILKKV